MEVWPTGRESHEDSARPGGAFSADFDYATTPGTRLPFAKQPKIVLFGDEIPYTSTGKPKRLELKAKLATALAQYRDRQFKDRA